MAHKKTTTAAEEAVLHTVITPADLSFSHEVDQETANVNFAQCIRVLRQNWRQGTVGCKDRSEVAFANRKPWKQKGTGRARAGSLRSPLWRKGGVAFGPQPRVRSLRVTQELKKNVFKTLLFNRLHNQQVLALDWALPHDAPKTSLAYKALKQSGLHNKHVILFVDAHDYHTQASFANMPNVSMYLFDQPNAYALSHGDCWVYLKKDNDLFKQMVDSWN